MRVTELIEQLNAILKDKGDVEVYCWPYDGQGMDYPVKELAYYEETKLLFIEA